MSLLQDRVCIITGAGQGLGRAVADELAAEGASLIVCSRSKDSIRAVADSITRHTGVEVVSIGADLSIKADVERVVRAGLDRFGQIDILVTNVGGPPAGRFEDLDSKAWKNAATLLLDSVLNLTRLVLPGMKERGWGRILNITSIASKQPVDNLILSNSLRAAVTGFAKTLANEVAPFGVTVNNVLPGYTRT